jgi:hypothetical protein
MLRCVFIPEVGQWNLTINKLYEFDKISKEAVSLCSTYYIKDDNGQYRYFVKEWFIDLSVERQTKLEQLGID